MRVARVKDASLSDQARKSHRLSAAQRLRSHWGAERMVRRSHGREGWRELGSGALPHRASPLPAGFPGWMHSGYPIMCHLESAQVLISEASMRSSGLWGPIHELGHNQQQSGWEFPPHTTEATCNLWSVYVHETILGIPRAQAHPALNPAQREERIKEHLGKGAPLSDWNVWTALETYLQVPSHKSGRWGHQTPRHVASWVPPPPWTWETGPQAGASQVTHRSARENGTCPTCLL